jgi:hypothetical protein
VPVVKNKIRSIFSATDSKITSITITVDIAKGFEVQAITYTNEADDTGSDAGALVHYTLDIYLCDNLNALVTHVAAFVPGEALTFCVRTDTTTDAAVNNLPTVK